MHAQTPLTAIGAASATRPASRPYAKPAPHASMALTPTLTRLAAGHLLRMASAWHTHSRLHAGQARPRWVPATHRCQRPAGTHGARQSGAPCTSTLSFNLSFIQCFHHSSFICKPAGVCPSAERESTRASNIRAHGGHSMAHSVRDWRAAPFKHTDRGTVLPSARASRPRGSVGKATRQHSNRAEGSCLLRVVFTAGPVPRSKRAM